MHALRKILILSHRYIGIPLSFMFVVWFVSAFFMIYTGGMPRITPEMRIEGASAIDFSQVTVNADQAAQISGMYPDSVSLRNVLNRPVYDISAEGYGRELVYADNGELVGELNQDQARLVAADFLGMSPEQLRFDGTLLNVDQWSLTQSRDLPLYKFSANDDLGTEAYVSSNNANVSVYTTTKSRVMAWLGTIPHWLYFTSLRLNQPLWYDIVVWSSSIGCIMALLGLILGVTQFRKVKPFSFSRAIPYQGMMRWHYILGVVFGVVTLTWVFSGLLSMEPYSWTSAPGLNVDRNVYQEGELDLAAFPDSGNVAWDQVVPGQVKELEYRWIQDQPYFVANYSQGDLEQVKRDRLHQPYQIIGQSRAESVLVDAGTGQLKTGFDAESLVNKLAAGTPGANVVAYDLLNEYDDYYYSRNSQLPLPVLRVKFDDPQASWIYVDPQQSQLLTLIHKWSRVERWLYSGLHSLDFAFWYHKRPLWDIGVIFLLAGGLAVSCLGLYFGLRRLKRDFQYLLSRLTQKITGREHIAVGSTE